MRRSLSPRDLAQAIGLSESSLKRWVDAGKLRASRTEGGHRRITLPDAVRFIREQHHVVLRPDLLGLPALPAPRAADDDPAETLYGRLHDGDAAGVRGFVLARYLDGETVAALCDGPVRAALERVGELWKDSPEGIFIEHRASDLCLQAFAQIRATLQPPRGAPVAVGGTPSGDTHLLSTFLAATVLAEADVEAVNLGPDTPSAALEAAIARHAPRLVWMSVTMPVAPDVAAATARVLRREAAAGRVVIVGGRHADSLRVRAPVRTASSMGELADAARALR